MNVLHLSVGDGKGGAARAAYRLHESLVRCKVHSSMLVLQKSTEDPQVRQFQPARRPLAVAARLLTRLRHGKSRSFMPPGGHEIFSKGRSRWRAEVVEQIGNPDVLNLHWVAGMFDYGDLFSSQMPMVWTLHDMHPFTGGCHYNGACTRFSEACGCCPQLQSFDPEDISHQLWRQRSGALSRIDARQLTIVSPSNWLATECQKSSLLGRFPTVVIPYGIDSQRFQPIDRSVARSRLGIAPDASVVLFVADSVGNPRKGLDLLVQALERLTTAEKMHLLSIGNQPESSLQFPFPYTPVSHVNDDQVLAEIYSAADVFVIPSRQDNLPNTVLEAMACGVPTVGFDVGGISEMIVDGKTGFLAAAETPAALGHGIEAIVRNHDLRKHMAIHARQRALEDYSLEAQGRRYQAIYTRLIQQNRWPAGQSGSAAAW